MTGHQSKRVNSQFAARAEEEAIVTPTKLTNQLFVRSVNASNSNAINGADESMSAATFVSVVSHDWLEFARQLLEIIIVLC